MPNFTPITSESVKTIGQHDKVRERLSSLSKYARNAECAHFKIREALRWYGYDFAEYVDPSIFAANSGNAELELSTMCGSGVAGVLYLQWQLSRRLGEITFNAFIN